MVQFFRKSMSSLVGHSCYETDGEECTPHERQKLAQMHKHKNQRKNEAPMDGDRAIIP